MPPTVRRACARLCLPLLATVIALPLCGHLGASPAPKTAAKEKESEAVVPDFEIHLTDGGVLKVRLIDAELPLKTPFGKLSVPTNRIHDIECATRVPAAVAKKVKSAIVRLGGEEAKERKEAAAELVKLHRCAYPALLEAEKSDDAEVRLRARGVLTSIRQAAANEDLKQRPSDVVHTADSKIAGRLECEELRAETAQFGEVRLKLSDVRSMRSLTAPREERGNPPPPPPGFQRPTG